MRAVHNAAGERGRPALRALGRTQAGVRNSYREQIAMEVLLGFAIAVAIGVTGVGGGVITAPALILLLGMPPVEAVTISLVFAAIIKSLLAPQYLWRKQVDFRILGK